MAAAFFLMGVVAGLTAGLGVQGTSDAFFDGCRSIVLRGAGASASPEACSWSSTKGAS